MRPFQALRNAHSLTRLVLVCWALLLGVAVASPLVNPEGVQLVCTSAGVVKLVHLDADGQETQGNSNLHCPLCLPAFAPSAVWVQAQAHQGLSDALYPLEQARLASLTGLPWQARAPPFFS